MSALGNAQEQAIALPFRWRDQGGAFHHPAKMETRHLFFTLRMIWNHSMPESAKLRPYRAYQFSEFYTERYMAEAVGVLAAELSKRWLRPSWQADIQWMMDWLARRRPLLDAPQLQIARTTTPSTEAAR